MKVRDAQLRGLLSSDAKKKRRKERKTVPLGAKVGDSKTLKGFIESGVQTQRKTERKKEKAKERRFERCMTI